MDEPFDTDNLIMLPMARPAEAEDDGPAESPSAPPPVPEHLLGPVVESLLLASDRPLSVEEIARLLCGPGEPELLATLQAIRERLGRGGGIHLAEVAKGWQLRTDPRAAPWVAALRGGRPLRLSRAALEALSVVAYRQPVTRGEVDQLRGVDSGGVLRMLAEHELVTVVGRKPDPGRPLLYGTTPRFLEVFGLRDLSDLPALRALRELQRDDGREGLEGWALDEADEADAPRAEGGPDRPGDPTPPAPPTPLRPLE